MDIEKNNLLTPNQVTMLLIGFTMGVGILGLPNSLVKDSYQDAWMAALLGTLYPLYIGALAVYISNKHPDDTILTLSKKLCGRFFGTILNIVFLSYFIFTTTATITGYNNIVNVYAVPFLNSSKILVASLLVIAYTVTKGLKSIAKVSEIGTYFMFLVILTSLAALKKGSYLNLLPVFEASLTDILKSTKQSAFSYTGIEAILLVHPYINNKKKLKQSIFTSIGVTTFIYTYVTIITIYYLSADVIPKGLWSFALVTESFVFPVINNFRFIFIFIWTIVAFRVTSSYYYASAFILKDLLKKVTFRKLCYMVYPIIVLTSLKLTNETIRTEILELFVIKFVVFNIVYISLIALLVYFKRNDES